MPNPRALTVLLSLAVVAAPARAAKLAGGSTYSLPAGQTLLSDLYYGGGVLRIDGRLDGNAVAGCQTVNLTGSVIHNLYAAAQNVDVSGTVGGDLLALGATVNVTGAVGGALRAGCGTLYVNGPVGRDIVAGCQGLTVGRTSEVRGDVIAGCGALQIDGIVRGDVRASASEVTISGSIDGDVDVTVGERLTLTDDARIFGDLRYHADHELPLSNRDAVFGNIEYVHRVEPERLHVSRPSPGLLTAVFLPLTIFSLFAALAVGFTLVAIWKTELNSAIDACLGRFGYTVGFGALGFFATPLAIVLGLLLVITIPAALLTGLGYVVAIYLAKILTGMLLGRLLFRLFRSPGASLWAAAPVGIVVTYALCAIPVAGWVVWLFVQLLGFGILVELIAQTRRTGPLRL